jgi:hypothetical protein
MRGTTTNGDPDHRSLFSLPFIFLAGMVVIAGLAGCGGHSTPDCTVTALNLGPAAGTADHLAASPGNQVQFSGFDALNTLPSGCLTVGITQAMRTDLKWTVSDPVNVTIGNTLNVDYGRATCVNATAGPVTVTASGPNAKGTTITGTATLTCK